MSNTVQRFELSYRNAVGNVGGSMMNAGDYEEIGGKKVGALCVDKSGNIYISDPIQHAIFKINGLDHSVSVYAGLPGTSGANGGEIVNRYDARFNTPAGMSMDNTGNLLIADSGNNQIRVIGPKGQVGVLAGKADGSSGHESTTGVPTDMHLYAPADVCVDNTGKIYIADTYNHAIRMVDGGKMITIAGTFAAGDGTGAALSAALNYPVSVAVNRRGDVMIADMFNSKIKMLRNSYVYLMYTVVEGTLTYSDFDAIGDYFILCSNYTSETAVLLKMDEMSRVNTVLEIEGSASYGFAMNLSNELFVSLTDYSINSSSSSSQGSSLSSVSSISSSSDSSSRGSSLSSVSSLSLESSSSRSSSQGSSLSSGSSSTQSVSSSSLGSSMSSSSDTSSESSTNSSSTSDNTGR